MAYARISTVEVAPHNVKWIREQAYKNVSTDLTISELKGKTTLKEKKKESYMLLYGILSIVAELDPTKGLDKSKKRLLVDQYIARSYPYWENISYHDPIRSVEMLLQDVKGELKNYTSKLDLVFQMARSCLKQDDFKRICTLTQQLISYCVYYVHIKRNPKKDMQGGLRYHNTFVPCVDIQKWSSTYRLRLD